MKKSIAIAITIAAAVASMQLAKAQNNQNNEGDQPNGRIMEEARMQDGRYDLSKLLASDRLPDERKEAFKAADKDNDGFLTVEEARSTMNIVRGDRRNGPRGFRGPGFGPQQDRQGFFGRPGFGGPQAPNFGEAFKDGKLDLSKLPERMSDARKEQMKAADKDGDGFLSMEELHAVPRPKFEFREGEKPDFINDDNAFVIEKVDAFLKEFDKNSDGLLDDEEQKALADTIREKYRSLPFFVNRVLGNGPQFGGPQGGQPGFGAPQFGGPRGGQPGFGAPQFGGPRGGQPGFGAPQFGGPRGGQPGFGGPQGPGFFGDAFKDGKLDLSKLPEQTPQGIKDNLKNADKDSDGFLSEEEFKAITPPWGFHAPQFGAPMGGQPEFNKPNHEDSKEPHEEAEQN